MDNILDLLDIFVNSLSLVTISDMFKYLFIVFAIAIALIVLFGVLYVFFYLFLFGVILKNIFKKKDKILRET